MKIMAKEEIDKLYFVAMDLFDAGDKEAALYLFRQGAALGDDNAMNMIGLCYDGGDVVEQNKIEAIDWFKKSWRTGRQIYTCVNVAKTYEEIGQRQQALYWWKKAIASGDISVGLGYAQFLLQPKNAQPTEQIIALVRAAANAEAPLHVSFDEKEEAQALLEELTTQPPENTP